MSACPHQELIIFFKSLQNKVLTRQKQIFQTKQRHAFKTPFNFHSLVPSPSFFNLSNMRTLSETRQSPPAAYSEASEEDSSSYLSEYLKDTQDQQDPSSRDHIKRPKKTTTIMNLLIKPLLTTKISLKIPLQPLTSILTSPLKKSMK